MSDPNKNTSLTSIIRKVNAENRHAGIMQVFSAADLTTLNQIFGSRSKTIELKGETQCREYHRLVPQSKFYHGSRITSLRNKLTLLTSDWIIYPSDSVFQRRLNEELSITEDIVTSLMLYLLGGFAFPNDSRREGILKFIEVDVSEIFKKPRLLFLLSNLAPKMVLKFCYWRITIIINGITRSVLPGRLKRKAELCRRIKRRLKAEESKNERSQREQE